MRIIIKHALILISFIVLILSGVACAADHGVGPEVPSANSPTVTATRSVEPSPEIEATPVPESEMLHIVFSLEWILKNDQVDNPLTVKITFPSSWVTNAPPVPKGETPVELRVPKPLFNDSNASKNPDDVTVVFPIDYFIGMPVPTYAPGTPSPQLIREPPEINFFTQPGVSPPSEELKISAISGPLDWLLVSNASWLTLSASQGAASTKKETVLVSADAAGLGAGLHSANITFRQKGTDWSQDIPIRLFVTTAVTDTVLDIPVVADNQSAFVKDISLERAIVSTNTLERSGQNGWHAGYFSAGDLCFLVSGTMKNGADRDWLVQYYALGYDANGNEVSWTLDVDPGPLSGIDNIDLPAHYIRDFKLHLGWAENMTHIKLFANIYPQPE